MYFHYRQAIQNPPYLSKPNLYSSMVFSEGKELKHTDNLNKEQHLPHVTFYFHVHHNVDFYLKLIEYFFVPKT